MRSHPVESDGPRSLLRAARMLARRLDHPPRPPSSGLAYPVQQLLQRQEVLHRCWRMLAAAERRGWSLAAGRLRDELSRAAAHVRDCAAELAREVACARPIEPADTFGELLRTLLGELRQLGDEFESVEVDGRRRVVAVRTEPVEPAGLPLGPFRLELHADLLAVRPDAAVFRCVALEPNPAASDDDVTHPHVRSGILCAGDATAPIGLALRQGRVCDAFCLVRAVLREYNAGSPYVSSDDWAGVRCGDCDCVANPGDLSYCEACGRDVCDECDGGGCDRCGSSCCRGCLETDSVSDRACCPTCRHTCDDCGRTVDADHFDAETELCPECRGRQEDEPDPTEEITHDEPEGATGRTDVAAGAA